MSLCTIDTFYLQILNNVNKSDSWYRLNIRFYYKCVEISANNWIYVHNELFLRLMGPKEIHPCIIRLYLGHVTIYYRN